MAVSDDLSWVRSKLGSRRKLVLAGSHGQQELEQLDPIGADLALLAACNHTIVSQGVFGMWGAFLAGGDLYTKYGVMVQQVLAGKN